VSEKVTFSELSGQPVKLKRKEVTVEQWGGGKFYLMEISALTHRELMPKIKQIARRDENGDVRPEQAGELSATWLSHLLCDEDGQYPTVEWLMQYSLKLLTDLCNEGLEFNGLSDESEADIEKNSESPDQEPSGQ
jgi:hypothetical protein